MYSFLISSTVESSSLIGHTGIKQYRTNVSFLDCFSYMMFLFTHDVCGGKVFLHWRSLSIDAADGDVSFSDDILTIGLEGSSSSDRLRKKSSILQSEPCQWIQRFSQWISIDRQESSERVSSCWQPFLSFYLVFWFDWMYLITERSVEADSLLFPLYNSTRTHAQYLRSAIQIA